MDENGLLKYIELLHKGAMEAARAKYISHKRKNNILKDINKYIKKEKFKKIEASVKTLYAIVDGVERPLFISISRHTKNYAKLMDFFYVNTQNQDLKQIIIDLGRFFIGKKQVIKELTNYVNQQANILEAIKNNKYSDFEDDIKQFEEIQGNINQLYLSLKKEMNGYLLPIFHKLIQKDSLGKKIKTFFKIPSKEKVIQAYSTYDEQVKYNVALVISELAATLGGPIGAYITFHLTDNPYLGATVGAWLGDYVMGVTTFIPPWYIFHIKELLKKDKTRLKKHLEFIKYTGEILAKNIPAALLAYGVMTPLSLGLTKIMHPSLAVGIAGEVGSPIFQALSTWVNLHAFKKWKADKMKIEKELIFCLEQLNEDSLSIPNNWWWYKKKQVYKDYSSKISVIKAKLKIIEIRLIKDQSNIPKDTKAYKDFEYLKGNIKNIENKIGLLKQDIKIFKKEFLNLNEQKEISQKVNNTRKEIIKEINNLITELDQKTK